MRNLIDFSSWQGVLSTLLGMVVVTFVAVGIRLLVMHRVQQRRERQNRQINERLKTLIAAYKTLGGSFTGNLAVNPLHLRDARMRAEASAATTAASVGATPLYTAAAEASVAGSSERSRRIRDAVEAALSDVILLGTAEQVRLAAQAANDMVAGRPTETAALVRALRDFIREVLDLDAVPSDLAIPRQGPVRAAGSGGRGNAANAGGRTGGGGGGGGGGGLGLVAGGVVGAGTGHATQAADPQQLPELSVPDLAPHDADALQAPELRQP